MRVKLPQIEIEYPAENKKTAHQGENFFIVSGGRAPKIDWAKAAAANRKVWAVDKGADFCRDACLPPEKLIGDADSASEDAWSWAAKRAAVQKFPRKKDLTDTQIALKNLDETEAQTAVMSGIFGGRADHLYSTIFSAAYAKTTCVLADEGEVIFFAKNGRQIRAEFSELPTAVSLLPITEECIGVSMNNMVWSLDSVTLTQKFPCAVSNELQENKTDFRVKTDVGILAVYAVFAPW